MKNGKKTTVVNFRKSTSRTRNYLTGKQISLKCAQFKTSTLVAYQLFISFISKSIKNDE